MEVVVDAVEVEGVVACSVVVVVLAGGFALFMLVCSVLFVVGGVAL